MTSPSRSPALAAPPGPRAPRWAAGVAAGVAGLTILFTAQDVFRSRSAGQPMAWGRSLSVNLLDWVAWALLVPVLVGVGRRIRLDRGRRIRRLGAWLLLGAALCVTQAAADGVILDRLGLAPAWLRRDGGGLLTGFLPAWIAATFAVNMVIFGMMAGSFHAALYYRDLRNREVREADLEARLARAELSLLRMQIQPHFLFNALHTVSALMVNDVPGARRVLASLGDMLRSSLERMAKPLVPLRDELAFVRAYLDIQRARFRGRLETHLDVPDAVQSAVVPSLVLQPLVENAIRHGIEPHSRPGRVWITAARVGDRLRMTVKDDGPGAAAPEPPGQQRQGIGLANLAARLEQVYGNDRGFSAGPDPAGGFVARLEIPFRVDDDGAAGAG